MLSTNLLSQLNQLKHDIRESKDINIGTVRGTSGRYGFVSLQDGRDAFLNPDQMERVFPGDNVEIEVTTIEKNGKEQYEAKLVKLITSPLAVISGRYRVRGKGHFIATDSNDFSRWIFIPPKDRAKCEEGQYATARVTRHPFKDGRAQAKITQNIGNDSTDNIERLYTMGKYQLSTHFPKDAYEQAKALQEQAPTTKTKIDREDLSHIPFVTIDSVSTRDMDDAISAQPTENGWLLSVAIANPGADIAFNSPLDKAAQQRAQTIYFPGKPLAMLPEGLSIEQYSLKSELIRTSLVFQCEISSDGRIDDFRFIPALIKSHAKLSYTQVAAIIEEREYEAPEQLSNASAFIEQLKDAYACTQALHRYREEHHIVIENKPDFALYLNEKGKLDKIDKIERNCAHTIVEEAMLATNRCAGDFLASHGVGLYTHHRGYREERRADIEALLSEKTASEIKDTNELKDFIKTIKALQNEEEYQPLLSIQQRFLEAESHFGLGFQHYATVTSPIRRYQDLFNQRIIHLLLTGEKPEPLTDSQLEQLQSTINSNRNASRFMEQWLIADFIKPQIGNTFEGTISLLTNQGVGVRLKDTGIEGFIPAKRINKKNPEKADKISFNNQRMELSWNGTAIHLDQPVSITLTHVDNAKKKLEFRWVEKPSDDKK